MAKEVDIEKNLMYIEIMGHWLENPYCGHHVKKIIERFSKRDESLFK